MEVELKYLIKDNEQADRIWEDLKKRPDALGGSEEEKLMDAVYFDSEDERLSKEKIAVRVRKEGELMMATVKWGGNQRKASDDAALHSRPELNVGVTDERWFEAPPADMFGETEIGRNILEVLDGQPLKPLLETKFTRRLVKLQMMTRDASGAAADNDRPDELNTVTCEAAVDTGWIIAGEKREPICELELELISGDSAALVKLGRALEAQYGLTAGAKSKFARGRALRVRK